MTEVEYTQYFDCSAEELFKVLSDYNSYPEFLKEIHSCQVLRSQGEDHWVEYEIDLIRKFKYTNKHTHQPPHEMRWVFESGDLFRSMEGRWKLTPEGEKTRAQYQLSAQWSLFIPKTIARRILNIHLPAMMKSYQKRVEKLYGQRGEKQEEDKKQDEKKQEEKIMEERENTRDHEKVSFNWDQNPEPSSGTVSGLGQKLLAMGLSAPFLSEEQIHQYISGLPLPREFLNSVLQGARKSKEDFMGKIGGEIRQAFEKMDWTQEVQKFFQNNKISLKMEIDFVSKKKDSDPQGDGVP